jgi:hypothetical protein
MVSMLAIRPKVCRFKPIRGKGFLRMIKMYSMHSSGEEVKQDTPCRKILWHVKVTCKYEQKTVQVQIHDSLHAFFLLATR